MKSFMRLCCLVVLFVFISSITADTFTHKEDGSSFTGFATQKETVGKTLVYNSEEDKMVPVVLNDYRIQHDKHGRRDYVVLIQIVEPDILLSKRISERVAAEITNASNTGPQAIILQIDNPGGRGEYMKIITSALSNTKNCPIIAYISGENFGGAFSAASILAMVCDKVFIHPAASIGAVGSASGRVGSGQDFTTFLQTYCPDSLIHYSTYAASLAENNGRPKLLVQALLDKRLAVAEVSERNGSRVYILEQNRQPTQTLIRKLTEGIDISIPQIGSEETVSPIDIVGKVLSLTANDAVATGLADKTAENIQEALSTMEIAEVSVRPDKGIGSVIKKYQAVKRNIDQNLLRINNLEEQVNAYDEQYKSMDSQLRGGTQIRETPQDNTTFRGSRNIRPSDSDYYSNYYNDEPIISNRGRRNTNYTRNERIIREEPVMDIGIVYEQLTGSLRDLVAEYRRVVNLAKQWPGGLPLGMTVDSLQNNMDSASNDLDILYRNPPVYPSTIQNSRVNRNWP